MGRGNACVNRDYEGLFYIDNDDLDVYRRYNEEEDVYEVAMLGELSYEDMSSGWELDELETQFIWEETVRELQMGMVCRFKSFSECDEWVSREEHAILENNLFYVVVEDNQWSMAVKLIRKDDDYADISGLQKKHYQRYLSGIRDVLFERFETLGVYGGPWTSGRISKNDYVKEVKESA